MTEINRPKLNLSALKWNKPSTTNNPINQEKKASINQNTGDLTMKKPEISKQTENTTIKKPSISINKVKPAINTQATTLNKTPEIKTNIQKPENNIEIKKEEKQENKTTSNTINTEKKSENIEQTKQKTIENKENKNLTENEKTKLTEKIKETPNLEKTEEIKENTEIKSEANIENKEKEQINENWEIFSGYTSDFAEKKEKALKEAKKFKLPDSPKKIFFAIFTSLLILSSLALVIIFKVDNPTTNKLKTNVLELIGKAEKKPAKIEKKVTETWTPKTYTSLWFNIQYEVSNTNKYKVEWKILNNKSEFDNYIKNKIDKLAKEKLKEHLQEEK